MQQSEQGKLFLNCQLISPACKPGNIAFNSKLIIAAAEKAVAEKRALAVMPALALTGGYLEDLHNSGDIIDQVQHYLQDILLASINWPTNFVCIFGTPIITPTGQYNGVVAICHGKIVATAAQSQPSGRESAHFAQVPATATDLPASNIFLLPIFGPYNPLRIELTVGDDLFSYQPATCKANVLIHVADAPYNYAYAAKLQKTAATLAENAKLALISVNSGAFSASDNYLMQASYNAYEGDLCLAEETPDISDYFTEDCYADDRSTDYLAKAAALSYKHSLTCSFSVPRLQAFLSAKGEVPAETCACDSYFDLHAPVNRLFNPAPYLFQSYAALQSVNFRGFAPCYLQAADQTDFYGNLWRLSGLSLLKRLRLTRSRALVLGLSGGLDSTVAVLSCYAACLLGQLPTDYIYAVKLPGFGSSGDTCRQADDLVKALGLRDLTINITAACKQHFSDIEQPAGCYDVAFENAQARERTQILMDKANQVHGFVVGTGDLSEECLGFCTYNGDQMSMFNPNIGIPKSMMPPLLAAFPAWLKQFKTTVSSAALQAALEAISAHAISPELLPLDAAGQQQQATQKQVGSYVLHDFFFYHLADANYCTDDLLTLAYLTFSPENIAALEKSALSFAPYSNVFACRTFSKEEIKATLAIFTKRYISQQFKRLPAPAGLNFTPFNLTSSWKIPADLACNPFFHQKY